jgi:hypothetical protein
LHGHYHLRRRGARGRRGAQGGWGATPAV